MDDPMEKNKINKFLLATSILSMTILLIGATYSYFSMSAMSKMNALSVEAGKVRIGLGVSPIYTGYDLIPLKDELIDTAYENKCLDYLGRGACLAYGIEVFNFSKSQTVDGVINFKVNGIQNLTYMVLDENGNVYQDALHIGTGSKDLPLGPTFSLADASAIPSTSKKFTILIWLSENYKVQDETDSNGNFSAVVTYSSINGGKLTATVDGTKMDMQD